MMRPPAAFQFMHIRSEVEEAQIDYWAAQNISRAHLIVWQVRHAASVPRHTNAGNILFERHNSGCASNTQNFGTLTIAGRIRMEEEARLCGLEWITATSSSRCIFLPYPIALAIVSGRLAFRVVQVFDEQVQYCANRVFVVMYVDLVISVIALLFRMK